MKTFFLFVALLFLTQKTSAQYSPYQRVDSLIGTYTQKVKNRDDLRKLWYFIYQNIYTDSLRLRAAVVWIANNIAYDVKSWQNENVEAGQLEYVLRHKKAVCGGYASLLKELCDMFKIECEVVVGRARAFERDVYLQQSKLSDNHAWNMVKINDQWRLIDPTWVSGSVSGDADDPKARFIQDFNETYYFTPPEKFILNHFPRQSRHQLLSPAINEKIFRTSPLYLESFLQTHVAVVAPVEALIKAAVGDTIVFQFKTSNLSLEMMAWSPTQKKAEYKGESVVRIDTVEFSYPVTATGFYNLFVGQVKGMRGEALLAYKLQIEPRRSAQ